MLRKTSKKKKGCICIPWSASVTKRLINILMEVFLLYFCLLVPKSWNTKARLVLVPQKRSATYLDSNIFGSTLTVLSLKISFTVVTLFCQNKMSKKITFFSWIKVLRLVEVGVFFCCYSIVLLQAVFSCRVCTLFQKQISRTFPGLRLIFQRLQI